MQCRYEADLLWELHRVLALGMDPVWALRVLDAMPDLASQS